MIMPCFQKKLLLCAILIVCMFSLVAQNVKILNGEMCFYDSAYASNNLVNLDGNWEFYWNKLFTTAYYYIDNDGKKEKLIPDSLVTVPDFWNSHILNVSGEKTSIGCGSYRMMLTNLQPNTIYAILIRESPGTACRIFANSKEIAQAGKVSADPKYTFPMVMPIYAEFNSDDNGTVELIIQVSNSIHRKGGLWSSVYFSGQEKMFQYYNTQTGSSWLIAGTMLVLCLLNVMLFFLTPKRKEYLFFSIFVFALGIRVSVAGFSILTLLFPNISYSFQLRLEYLAIWLAPMAFLLVCYYLYPTIKKNRIFNIILFSLGITLGLAATLIPIQYANHLVPVLELFAVACVIEVGIFLVRAILHNQSTVWLTFASFAVVSIGLIGDVVFTSRKDVMTLSVMPILLLVFSILQFLLLALQQSRMYRKQVQLVDDMKKLNDAYLRFVPREFLELLEKHSMTDVLPGDNVEREMAIIFSQIRFENKDGTDIEPEEQYALFNSFLMKISPITTKYNGFISKFISHGFMSLFPLSTRDALLCGLEIAEELKTGIVSSSGKKIKFGIGIHTGKMILGTIGETNRLDDTVISDTVNTASRIESVAERESRPIILSQQAYDAVANNIPSNVTVESLGSIPVKGKVKPVSLYSFSMQGCIMEMNHEK